MRINSDFDAEIVETWILDGIKRGTTLAGLYVAPWCGMGDKDGADLRGVFGLTYALNRYLPVRACVKIGEGKMDKAPMLYVGQQLGPPGPILLDIAVDPIDGTNQVADKNHGGTVIVAAALRGEGELFGCEYEGYMDKFVVTSQVRERWEWCMDNDAPKEAPGFNPLLSPFDQDLETVVRFIAWASNKPVDQLNAGMLKRPRNAHYLHQLRKLNVKCTQEQDGDVALAVSVQDPKHHLDFAIGSGGSPEGVLGAAAIRVARGEGWFRWWFSQDDTAGPQELEREGIDWQTTYRANDLAKGHVLVSITAITDTDSMRGVRYEGGNPVITTFFGRSRSGTEGIQISRHQAPPAELEAEFVRELAELEQKLLAVAV